MIRTSAGLPHGGRSSGPKTWGGCRWVRQTPCLPTSEWTAAARLLPPRSQRGARWRVSWRMSARECVGVCEISLSMLLLTPVILLWRVRKSPDSSWTLNSSWMALLLVYSAVTNGTSLHVILPTWKHRKSVYTEAGHCHSQDLLLLTHNGKITHTTCNFRAFSRAVSSLHSARLSPSRKQLSCFFGFNNARPTPLLFFFFFFFLFCPASPLVPAHLSLPLLSLSSLFL